MDREIMSQRDTANIPLYLFDIDGTLLRGMPPVHRNALCAAGCEVYGVALTAPQLGHTAGMTDTAILRRALLGVGVSDAVIAQGLPACFASASAHYERLVPDDLRPYHTPHAAETLAWLGERGATLGLVTGNVARIAAVKLAAAGLADFFPTAPTTDEITDEITDDDQDEPPPQRAARDGVRAYRPLCGAFGDEAEARAALPPLALARAQLASGVSFTPDEVFVVGDTPDDIACGAAHGLRTVAVATGQYSLADLQACRPDYILTDLSELRPSCA